MAKKEEADRPCVLLGGKLGAKFHNKSKGVNMLVGNWEVEFLGRTWGKSSKTKEELRRGWKGHNCYNCARVYCT